MRRKLTSAEEVSAVANEATRAQERYNALRRQGDEKARKLIDMSNEYALPSLLPLAPWHAHILTSFGATPFLTSLTTWHSRLTTTPPHHPIAFDATWQVCGHGSLQPERAPPTGAKAAHSLRRVDE